MRLARILYPVHTLGPGSRVGLWTCGCMRKCPGCANPELWDMEFCGDMRPGDIVRVIRDLEKQGYGKPDGITITGGEPFLQREELKELVEGLREITEDILIYTGFMREELADCEETIISRIAVLVDGPYLQEQNREEPLRGSGNQNIYYRSPEIKSRYEAYIAAMEGKRLAQNFMLAEGKACIGIHGSGFREAYMQKREEYGKQEGLHQ